MATSVYPAQGGAVDNTSAASFIPEIWSDEVVAAYKSNLVLAPLVKKMSMSGKKGDTIHIPKPTRGSANAKVANTAVTIQNSVESEVIVSINKHFEFSRMIEDITNVQAHSTLRAFYTGDAGYGLAKQIDTDLFDLSKSFGDGNGSAYATSAAQYVDATTGLTEYEVDTLIAGDAFTDAGFRAAIQLLDDQDVPMDGRSFVVPPVLRNVLMGIDRYVSSDFVSGGVVANGKIGNLYGTDLYISTNCPTLEAVGENAANTGESVRGAIMFHKEAMILAEQAAVRSQTQYKQEFLGTLYTADCIYGTQVIRPESGLLIAVNG
mgnify:CR=1 FL=1|tara:strand:- start:843 stop:1802 length:960 start_codon:yes stop_codon:yes gene_type:complete